MSNSPVEKAHKLIGQVEIQFRNRTVTEGRKRGVDYGVSLFTHLEDNGRTLWLDFYKGTSKQSVTIPIPYMENNATFIQCNDVVRAVCPFWLEEEQRELDYLDSIYRIVLDSPNGLISHALIKKATFLQQIVTGLKSDNATIPIYKLQRAVNELVSKMPLHETLLNSYIMNNRLIIIDEEFDGLQSPAQRLDYQVSKCRKYHSRGWTQVGLSDGTLVDANCILKIDLRKLSPFGLKYHNPQRNLYSTLGMRGDEFPKISSRSAKNLADSGISRTGWNLFTAFVDVPGIFEDQILVDKIHANKAIKYNKRVQTFGLPKVKMGEMIKTGTVISEGEDGSLEFFKIDCDSAMVQSINRVMINVGGVSTPAYNINIKYERKLCDGFKFTNMHGNKGVIRLADLGHAKDQISGGLRKIDVIVGAKTVGKRKNFGQILEALTNNILEKDAQSNLIARARRQLGIEVPKQKIERVIEDDWHQNVHEIEDGLERRGFRRDGTWDCHTPFGDNLKAVCGDVFWGAIKAPHDQLWEEGDTERTNNKELRTAGLKFSHVEFRALETMFGADNAIHDEVMSYAQGAENVHELLTILRSKLGEYDGTKKVLDWSNIKPVDQGVSTILPGQYISGTVVDEFFCPEGFMMKLPLALVTLTEEDGKTVYEGSDKILGGVLPKCSAGYRTDRVYIPSGVLRKCWRHGSGRYGLSELGVAVNNLLLMSHRLMGNLEDPTAHRFYFNALMSYFNTVTSMLISKRGELSNCSMAVRLPMSVKAVATLSTSLPKNVVEIHRGMANILKVQEGDIVLAERFPCLGFMSIRVQKVHITDNPLRKYVISASGNSLVSQNLDFDGDVLYLASFHTDEAKKALIKEWTNPNKTYYDCIQQLNGRKGAPHIKEYALQDYAIAPFVTLNENNHADIVEKNAGVKAQTGPVIALTYNLMRIVENSDLASDHKMKVAVEMFLEKAAQSVFEQKHGGTSLYDIVINGICTADVERLVEVGFKRSTTEKLCSIIKERATSIGVFNLIKHHEYACKFGGSNIISKIVRSQNKIYFVSRASLGSGLSEVQILSALDGPAVDIPSKMFKWTMKHKSDYALRSLDKFKDNAYVSSMKTDAGRESARTVLTALNKLFSKSSKIRSVFERMPIKEYVFPISSSSTLVN